MGTAPGTLDEAETALQAAQRDGDVPALAALLHPDVLYVGPDGAVSGRAADLEAHRSGLLRLAEVVERERTTRQLSSTTGTTCVHVHLRGAAGGQPLEADVVYTRTWLLDAGGWRVVLAHGSVLAAVAEARAPG